MYQSDISGDEECPLNIILVTCFLNFGILPCLWNGWSYTYSNL